jgi:glycerol-3-phosphate acyltransferase PlsY
VDPIIALFAAALGYLFGSVSFARIVTKIFAPEFDIGDGVVTDVPGGKEPVRIEAVAGTAVATKLGDKYGGLTAILDMLKVAAPTLALRLAFPDVPYHLISATTGVIGHNWPIYHGFRGGRGLSAILGGLLVIDPIGTLITSVVAMLLGIYMKNILLAYSGGTWLMIPWLWIRTGDPAHLVYVVTVNIIFVVAMIPDIRRRRDRRHRGVQPDFDASLEATPMGRGMKRLVERLGLYRAQRT